MTDRTIKPEEIVEGDRLATLKRAARLQSEGRHADARHALAAARITPSDFIVTKRAGQ